MLLLLVLNAASSPLKTFGTGRSAFVLTTNETTVFSHTVSPGATHAVLTHFWTTAFTHAAADNATIRYYVDGESQPSIEFKPSMAAGAGFDDQAMFGLAQMGHASKVGGWSNNFKVPFGATLRVTMQLALTAKPTTSWVIVRGCESLPIAVGTVPLPPTARLSLHKIEAAVFQPGEHVPLLDLPEGGGLVYMHAIAVESTNTSFWEGCYHLFTPHATPFPGVLLGTGMEDYFDSACTRWHNHGCTILPCRRLLRTFH